VTQTVDTAPLLDLTTLSSTTATAIVSAPLPTSRLNRTLFDISDNTPVVFADNISHLTVPQGNGNL